LLIFGMASLIRTRGRSWLQWITVTLVGGCIFLVWDALSSGWYSYYSVEMLSTHPLVPTYWSFWNSLLRYWGAAILIGLLACVPFRPKRENGLDDWACVSLAVALILASWSVFFKTWTYDNAYLPACAGLAVLAGLGYRQGIRWGQRSNWQWQSRLANLFILVLLGVQFSVLAYDPAAQYPTNADQKAALEFVERLQQLPGDVWVFHHGYYGFLAGKKEFFKSVPLGDVVGGGLPPSNSEAYQHRKKITDLWRQAVDQQIADWVVVDKITKSFSPAYVIVEQFLYAQGVFFPVTGAAARPAYLMARNPIARGGELPIGDSLYDRLFDGWQPAQDKTRSIQSSSAQIEINLEPNLYQLEIQVAPLCQSSHVVASRLSVSWNNDPLGELVFPDCQVRTTSFEIPLDKVLKDPNSLLFNISSDVEKDTLPSVRFYSIKFQRK